MGEQLIKPYEISIWENKLIKNSDGTSYYKENKIAVIGSDTMTAQNRVYSPIFKKNVNGEKTLTFSLAYKYYDDEVGDFVVNPFNTYLINERIVKLKYEGKWYDFVIKECDEDKESRTFTYTASDMFVQELSKTGYNITFNTELNNNLGTVTELGQATLKNTDWEVDLDNSDILKQSVSEPIYECTILNSFKVKNVDTDEEITIADDKPIYIFYTYIANKTEQYVQFLREVDKDNGNWKYDDNDAIIGTNYRIQDKVSYEGNIIKLDGTDIIEIGEVNLEHQGYRLVYNQKTTYDPVMERTVNEYKAIFDDNKIDIYGYDDYIYTSSNVVMSYITNGSNFNIYSEGSLAGWSNVNYITGGELLEDNLVTFPRLDTVNPLISLDELKKIRGYLELEYPAVESGRGNYYANSFFNQGITDSASLLDHISKGEKYVYRIRYQVCDEKAEEGEQLRPVLPNNASIRAVVAGYDLVKKTLSDGSIIEVKKVDTSKIYLDFTGEFKIGNNYVEGGEVKGNLYIIDNVVQTPSLKYVYIDKNTQEKFVWDADIKTYAPYNENVYSNYLYVVAEAARGLNREDLTDIGNRIGIFIYDNSEAAKYAYIEEIELFRYVDSNDGAETPIMPGNAPLAQSTLIHTYYLKPEEQLTADQVNTYNSIESLAADIGIKIDEIVSVRNENCEKILSIEEAQSNCFNILQSLCETFECWLDIRVEHEENGAIRLDKNFKPIKRIAFKEYIGKDNFAGFKYGINLDTITKNIDSNEFVTKLIVGQPSSEYTDSGVLSITDAQSNPSRESYILNLNYYLNQHLIEDRNDCLNDINGFYTEVADLNQELYSLNKSYTQASNALVNINASRSVFIETYELAAEEYVKALADFEEAVGESYESYRRTHEDSSEILENQSVADIIGRIYNAATILNSYGGIVTNIKNEYNRLNLLVNGAETYNVVISTVNENEEQEGGTKLILSNYVEGFECTFFCDSNMPEVPQPENFTSRVNNKTFDTNNIFTKVTINKIPENYFIEYTFNNSTTPRTVTAGTTFKIYDMGEPGQWGNGKTVKFRLVPDTEYSEANKGYKQQIKELEEQKQGKVNEFDSKYSKFIQEGTWESNNYIDSELYYLDAVEVSNVSAQPKVSYEIKVVEISEIEGYENYSFDAGDKTYIEDPDFFGYKVEEFPGGLVVKTPIKEDVVVSEVEWHLDEPQNNIITVQNYKTQFEDLFQRISAAVQSLTYNQASYTRAASILDTNGRIKAGILAKSLNAIAGSQGYDLISNGIIRIVEDGILVQDLTNTGNSLIIKSGGISLSTDGGMTWTEALTPKGLNANVVNAGTINTSQIMIMDGDNPTFRWDRAGLNAYGFGENAYDLNTYVRFDKYGLYGLKNGEGYVCTSLEDIKEKAHFGVTWDGFFIKNSYTNGYVSITSDNDFQVMRNLNDREIEKIKIGALDFDLNGNPIKYGIRIRNNDNRVVMETGDDGNLTVTGTINATAGHIGGLFVDGEKLTMNTIVLEPGVGIYSTNLIATDGRQTENGYSQTYESVFTISDVDGSATFNQIKARGEINATSGNFTGLVTVGRDSTDKPYIEIDGLNTIIKSSNYQDGNGLGWLIDGNGDATFNNVSVRGAIKTAVFEYAEIQAVGGAFLFRPSSTITAARIDKIFELTTDTEPQEEKIYYLYNSETGEYEVVTEYTDYLPIEIEATDNPAEMGLYELVDNEYILTEDTEPVEGKTYYEDAIKQYYELVSYTLILEVDSSNQFNEEEWCKISNYAAEGNGDNTGLVYVYKLTSKNENEELIFEDVDKDIADRIDELPGGALISFGYEPTSESYEEGVNNYGIGINSSDNFVDLPPRAISLFESVIHPEDTVKVTYDYQGVLGTLPEISKLNPTRLGENEIYPRYMEGTQGIYTDNMYIGDKEQFIAFYTDDTPQRNKHLRICASELIYDINTGETWEDKIDEASGLTVEIMSTLGPIIKNKQGVGAIYAKVYKGETEYDAINENIGTAVIQDAEEGDQYIYLDDHNKIATLMEYHDGVWEPKEIECTYEWTVSSDNQDLINQIQTIDPETGEVIPKTDVKCLYFDGSWINGSLTIDVKVTTPSTE